MKKLLLSGVAIVVIALALKLLIETPGSAPFVVGIGVVGLVALIGTRIFLDFGSTAERWRNRRALKEQRREEAGGAAHKEQLSPTALTESSSDESECPRE